MIIQGEFSPEKDCLRWPTDISETVAYNYLHLTNDLSV